MTRSSSAAPYRLIPRLALDAVEDSPGADPQLVLGELRRATQAESLVRFLGRVGVREVPSHGILERRRVVRSKRPKLTSRVWAQEHAASHVATEVRVILIGEKRGERLFIDGKRFVL